MNNFFYKSLVYIYKVTLALFMYDNATISVCHGDDHNKTAKKPLWGDRFAANSVSDSGSDTQYMVIEQAEDCQKRTAPGRCCHMGKISCGYPEPL